MFSYITVSSNFGLLVEVTESDLNSAAMLCTWIIYNTETAKALVHALVMSHIVHRVPKDNYWSTSACVDWSCLGCRWDPMNLTMSWRACFTGNYTGWTSLNEFNINCEWWFTSVYKAARAPQYLTDCCTLTSDISSRQRLRSATRHQLNVPQHYCSRFECRAFSVAGPRAWNHLPDCICDTSLISGLFRSALKTFLFTTHRNT